jgi:hypothetical protein
MRKRSSDYFAVKVFDLNFPSIGELSNDSFLQKTVWQFITMCLENEKAFQADCSAMNAFQHKLSFGTYQ